MAAMPTASRARAAAVASEQRSVDTARGASIEFAPTGPPNGSPSRSGNREVRRAPIAVGPGRPAVVVPAVPVEGGLLGAMPEFPVQLNKIQPPPLREDTLARDRLLDWLAAKIHDRVVLVIAEAGYGKTTLLADFSRRTRLRTLWYRLDRGDRDWVGFIAHLAAGVRAQVPEFGSATAALLRETGAVPPTLDAVLDTFLRELGQLPADATALILDDFHLVDDSPEIRHITKELLARAPERLTFVFASRRVPPVPLARLRALREVAELATDDLRFDEAETERLFRETYEMPLERGLITELSKRTEGWAASLQLVRAALHDRDAVQARAFIGSLSGAEGHLYDYLAEEVIGDLPADLQDFLMRTSILDTIDLELGPVAAGVSAEEARGFLAEAERLGLLGRRGRQRSDAVRAHPLVREFLQTRLSRSLTPDGVVALHRTVAEAARGVDWRAAASHFRAAGDDVEATRIVAASIDRILATGAYAYAHALVGPDAMAVEGPAGFVLASRVAMQDADQARGLDLAERALVEDPTSPEAALTVVTARSLAGDVAGAVSIGQALERSGGPREAQLARAYRTILEASVSGSIRTAQAESRRVLDIVDKADFQYRGISELGLAVLAFAAGNMAESLESAERAVSWLQATSNLVALTSARLARATALAALSRMQEARAEGEVVLRSAPIGQGWEVAHELAWTEIAFGDELVAARLIENAGSELAGATDVAEMSACVRAELALRRGAIDDANRILSTIKASTKTTTIAFEARRLTVIAQCHVVRGERASAIEYASRALELATNQGADLWAHTAHVVRASAAEDSSLLSPRITDSRVSQPGVIAIAAESVLTRVADLDDAALRAVTVEAGERRDRWLPSIRRLFDAAIEPRVKRALARILVEVGEREDLGRLQAAERGQRGGSSAKTLARRLASRVFVEDLGRVRIRVADRFVEGTEIRRKVLALLCFLLSREGFASTRDEVLDALWPDLDPPSALNSLNQTVYFLRRVFEQDFREAESPGYLHQDGETIWLDPELIDCRSRSCSRLLREVPSNPDPAGALALADAYVAKFALDFMYEDWASAFRETLHASFLRLVEQCIRQDTNSGDYGRAIALAERAVAVEPDSEELQVALVRLYRLAGAHAAAAEQYGRYATGLRAIGVDPPPFAAVVAATESIGTPAY